MMLIVSLFAGMHTECSSGTGLSAARRWPVSKAGSRVHALGRPNFRRRNKIRPPADTAERDPERDSMVQNASISNFDS